VAWNVVSNATSYAIERRAPGGAFAPLGTSDLNAYVDDTVSANTSYLYRVRAVNSAGSSASSSDDPATTILFTNDPLTAGATIIRAAHLSELRTAVNAMRALAGLTAATFTGTAAPGLPVAAIHINELRSALDQATAALARPTGGYTGTIGANVLIRAVHFQEIRNRVR
jgi:hypothetical protein